MYCSLVSLYSICVLRLAICGCLVLILVFMARLPPSEPRLYRRQGRMCIRDSPGTAGGSLQVDLTGFVAVPEPGSIALLSGLGLVVGRRLLKRRAKKQEAAV